jgi:predicted component of type VI protein secretion system
MDALQGVLAEFGGLPAGVKPAGSHAEPVLARLFSLVLGGRVSETELASEEVLERLAGSLNELFDTLNRLIATIDATLGGGVAQDETIRHVIGDQLEGESASMSLERHLGRIGDAFFRSHEAFQSAARKIVGDILDELDPQRIHDAQEGGLKFGPLKKAESFDVYQNKYDRCRSWYESDRFTTDLLREFEKRCQKTPP